MQVRTIVTGMAGALILWSASADSSALAAQEANIPLPQYPISPTDRPVTPLMEGWYDNGDGSYTISFGYLNRNENDTVRIAPGENNALDPEEFGGMQPTTFLPGRHHGVFTITFSGDPMEEEVWWSIHNTQGLDIGDHQSGAVHRVPGRARAEPYELDLNPRPHGSLPPLVWFESEDEAGQGPMGPTAAETYDVTVGEPLTLTVHVRDVSLWDINDPGIQDEVMPVGVTWFEHRSPAPVTFERHESTPLPEAEDGEEEEDPPANRITLPEAEGTARVIAQFSEPGAYVLRVRADNFSAPDSSPSDQCCYTNGYVHVNVAR